MADKKIARMGIDNRLRSVERDYVKVENSGLLPPVSFSESVTCYMHGLISGTAAGNDYRF